MDFFSHKEDKQKHNVGFPNLLYWFTEVYMKSILILGKLLRTPDLSYIVTLKSVY